MVSMNIVEIIAKKRDGGAHTQQELEFLMSGAVSGAVEPYQVSAWLMAAWLKGMTPEETVGLTQAMIHSGETVDLSGLDGIPVDKHSTGGVGDTCTLVLAPLVAAVGGKVAKMSGRGLGHTGGTLDKMEAAGLNVNLSQEKFIRQVREIGVAVISQTANLVPADGVLYALRDVTATIDSIPLIASSVMSKKLACGAQAIVLDVKYGDGAFMTELEGAKKLARVMVDIGKGLGRRVKAALTPMEQPLGSAIGNALEVREAIEVLTGKKANSALARVSCGLAVELLLMSEVCAKRQEAEDRVAKALSSGAAAEKMKEMFSWQGADPELVDHPERLPQAALCRTIELKDKGHLHSLSARKLGLAALELGAGRHKKSDTIDPGVGIVLHKRIGDEVGPGEPFAEVYASSDEQAKAAELRILDAATVLATPTESLADIAFWID